jgi:alkaline phosphatase
MRVSRNVAASDQRPILGAFAKNNMDLEWTGPTPTLTGTAPSTCAVNAARAAAQPHLADMAGKALQVLDKQTRNSRKGFFLQIEGASIDKQDHAANPLGV